jgi:hypothetical protein
MIPARIQDWDSLRQPCRRSDRRAKVEESQEQVFESRELWTIYVSFKELQRPHFAWRTEGLPSGQSGIWALVQLSSDVGSTRTRTQGSLLVEYNLVGGLHSRVPKRASA